MRKSQWQNFATKVRKSSKWWKVGVNKGIDCCEKYTNILYIHAILWWNDNVSSTRQCKLHTFRLLSQFLLQKIQFFGGVWSTRTPAFWKLVKTANNRNYIGFLLQMVEWYFQRRENIYECIQSTKVKIVVNWIADLPQILLQFWWVFSFSSSKLQLTVDVFQTPWDFCTWSWKVSS